MVLAITKLIFIEKNKNKKEKTMKNHKKYCLKTT